MVFHSASYIIHQEYLLSTLLSNALKTLQTHFIVSKKLWVELKREKKETQPLQLLQSSYVLCYRFMMKAFALKSCSLSFSMIICLRVFWWTLASLLLLRLLLREAVLPVETIYIFSFKWPVSKLWVTDKRNTNARLSIYRYFYCKEQSLRLPQNIIFLPGVCFTEILQQGIS